MIYHACMQKPYAESCDQNREPILAILREVFADRQQVLEIGSGTGQHAVYFAQHFPHLVWHTSDLPENHAGIHMWLDEAGLENVRAPVALDVSASHWPAIPADAVFSANAVHIMSWAHVENMFEGIGRMLPPGGKLCLYGPFNYDGKFTSDSNARFDVWLKQRDPVSGVRDFEAIDQLANINGLYLVNDFTMPANNRLLYWQRQ